METPLDEINLQPAPIPGKRPAATTSPRPYTTRRGVQMDSAARTQRTLPRQEKRSLPTTRGTATPRGTGRYSAATPRCDGPASTGKMMDAYTKVLLMQTLLGICVLLAALLIKWLQPDSFTAAKLWYQDAMQNQVNTSIAKYASLDFGSKVDSVREYITEVFAKTDDVATPASTTSAVGGRGGWLPLFGGTNTEKETQTQYNLPKNISMQRVYFSAKGLHPVQGVVSSTFGYRSHPITDKPDFHRGVDIAAPKGTSIYTVYPGVVVESGYSAVYGNYIILSHGDNVRSQYSHCDTILAKEGQVLRAGQRVATVGNTGISTGAHVHLDIQVGEIYINPLLIFDMV